MWLSVVFPTCPNCHENSNKCYHKDCPKGGHLPIELNPDTEFVRCPSCGNSWSIKESSYYCLCNYVFDANEVSDEINAIIANAKLVANELKRNAETLKRIENIKNNEIARKAKSTITKRFGKEVWEKFKKYLPSIINAIKRWLSSMI